MTADATPHWTIMVCPKCGRNDRYVPFTGKSHYHHGVRCDGVPEAVVVVPASALVDLRAENERLWRDEARAERDRLREREQHFASVLNVADGGQYRNDWDARITALVRERDEARDTAKRATDLAERYGEAIVAISDALPNVNKARVIIAALAVPAPPTTTEKNDE